MSTWLVFILYSILLAVAIYNIVHLYNKRKIINAFICFQVAFTLYYIVIPIVSHIVIEFYPFQLTGFILRISNVDSYDLFYAFCYTLIFYMTIMGVYYTRISKSPKLRTNDKKGLNTNYEYSIELNKIHLDRKVYRVAVTAGLITLIIGIYAELNIANSLGGILNAVSMGDKLRAFGGDNSRYIPQDRLFSIVLMVFSLASTYFFVYALRIQKNFSVVLLLIISILASVFYFLINAGRIGVLLYLLPFLIDFSFRKFKHPFVLMSVFSVLFIILLGFLDDLFFYLSYGYVKESSTSIFSIINEFAFPYLNLLHVNHINAEIGLRLGIDYFTWIINIIPTSILNIFGLSKVTTGYEFITDYYSGGNATGGIPTDLITLGMRQFGVIGILLTGLVITMFCKYFDRIIDKIHSSNFYFMTLRMALIMFIIIPYADLDSFIRNRYDMLLIAFFAIIVTVIRYRSSSKYDRE